jgi:Acetyltransferases, including N-acetylases of ribosomal proteins
MFESNRLNYRELNENDFVLFYDLYSNKEVMKFAYLDRFGSQEDGLEAFGNILLDQKDNNEGTQYVASLKESNDPIGIVDYDVILHHEKGGIYEIGYFMKPDYWGKGFGTEMGKALIDYLFNNFNIHKVTASCNFNNKNSEGIMIKLGMTKEGIFKKVRYKDNRWDDEIKYGLLKEEWMSNT